MKKAFFVLVCMFLFAVPAFAAAPVCLFTDVLSGPATGGEGGNGIYLTIFGKNFGSTQGTSIVTVNGTPAAQYLVWGHDNDATGNLDQIGVQIASGTTGTGNIVVTTPGGSCSNLTFTVRNGRIWYIGNGIDNDNAGSVGSNCTALKNGTAGNGSGGSGTYSSPWTLTNTPAVGQEGSGGNYGPAAGARTPYMYYYCMAAGDTLVFLDGANYPYYDGSGLWSSLALDRGIGSSSSPVTFQVRPGGKAQLGATGNINYGIRAYAETYVVLSGLSITGSGYGEAASMAPITNTPPYTRMVGNTITCPDCLGAAATLSAGNSVTYETSTVSVGLEILGNWVYNAGCSDLGGVSNKQFHFIYTNGNGEEIAWNKVGGTGATAGCAQNGIQVNYYKDNNTTGYGNLSIHDNDISYALGAGINLATIDPTQGPINVYNNFIHHVGIQPASDGGSFFTGVSFPGYGPTAATGTVSVYNNTLYDTAVELNNSSIYSGTSCAVYVSTSAGQTNLTVNLVNNIIAQPSYTYTSSANVYLCGSGTSKIAGSDNLFYSAATPGSTSPASSLTSLTVPTNPVFANATTPGPWAYLELKGTSPAIGAGSESLYPTLDFNGVTRPDPPSIGAYEPIGTSPAVQISVSATPNPVTQGEPATLTATVAQIGNSVPTGSIDFLNGTASLGQASLDSQGTATLVISWLSAGSYSVVAAYSGDSNYPAGKSGAVPLQVLSPTSTSLAASPNPVTTGQALNLVATVEGSGNVTPAGTVGFLNGPTLLGTGTLNSSGVASLSITSLAAGTYSLTAKYAGNADFLASVSPAVSVTVSALVNPAQLTSPAPGSTLTGPSATFSWTAVSGATGYYLYLGSTGVGSSNLYASGKQTGSSVTPTGLPTNGEKIYARLSTSYNGVLKYTDYTYTAAMQAALTSPAPGSKLPGSSATFKWTTATGATGYYLNLGSTGVGSSNLYASGELTGTSVAPANLPSNGEKIYARLSTSYNGVLKYTDYTFTAATQGALTSPVPGSTLTGSSVTFSWTAVSGAPGYYLYVGSTGAGSGNIFTSGELTGTSVKVTGLPTNGEKIYVRLSIGRSSVPRYTDYTYTAATQAALKSPASGSTKN
jgi:hypothetical protein